MKYYNLSIYINIPPNILKDKGDADHVTQKNNDAKEEDKNAADYQKSKRAHRNCKSVLRKGRWWRSLRRIKAKAAFDLSPFWLNKYTYIFWWEFDQQNARDLTPTIADWKMGIHGNCLKWGLSQQSLGISLDSARELTHEWEDINLNLSS